MTDIPTELRGKTKYLYLFNIVDHFTRYTNAYLLKNKKQNNIVEKLKDFFEEKGMSEEYGSDNGREFINSSVINYLNENNIKLINGRPYYPRSQGLVEKMHVTIRNGLLCKFLENKNNFNLEKDLKKVINAYN